MKIIFTVSTYKYSLLRKFYFTGLLKSLLHKNKCILHFCYSYMTFYCLIIFYLYLWMDMWVHVEVY